MKSITVTDVTEMLTDFERAKDEMMSRYYETLEGFSLSRLLKPFEQMRSSEVLSKLYDMSVHSPPLISDLKRYFDFVLLSYLTPLAQLRFELREREIISGLGETISSLRGAIGVEASREKRRALFASLLVAENVNLVRSIDEIAYNRENYLELVSIARRKSKLSEMTNDTFSTSKTEWNHQKFLKESEDLYRERLVFLLRREPHSLSSRTEHLLETSGPYDLWYLDSLRNQAPLFPSGGLETAINDTLLHVFDEGNIEPRFSRSREWPIQGKALVPHDGKVHVYLRKRGLPSDYQGYLFGLGNALVLGGGKKSYRYDRVFSQVFGYLFVLLLQNSAFQRRALKLSKADSEQLSILLRWSLLYKMRLYSSNYLVQTSYLEGGYREGLFSETFRKSLLVPYDERLSFAFSSNEMLVPQKTRAIAVACELYHSLVSELDEDFYWNPRLKEALFHWMEKEGLQKDVWTDDLLLKSLLLLSAER